MSAVVEGLSATAAPTGAGAANGTATFVLPRVNLLPPELAQLARLKRLQGGLAGSLLATVGVVVLLSSAASESVRTAADDLDTAVRTGSSLRAETATYAEAAAVHTRAAEAEAVLSSVMAQEVRYSELLNALGRTVPDDVWLKDVTFTQTAPADAATAAGPAPLGTVSFTGVAFSHDDVAAWLEALATQQGFTKPSLSGATTSELGERDVVTFSSTVELTDEVLSGRYTTPAGG